MNLNIKKLKTAAKWGGVLLALVAIYAGAIQYWTWKWDSPHLPLPSQHLEKHDIADVDPLFTAWAQQAQFEMIDLAQTLQSVSMSGAMTKNGKLVWAGAAGLASVEAQIPATINTQYRIGSVSKSITAVTLMRMVEAGAIDLDAPVHHYLPDYPRYNKDLTARQLASHMAGVRHYRFDPGNFPPTDGLSNVAYKDSIDALSQFKDDKLLFEPGKGFSYSTHGYTLLSAVMQAAGGKQFETLVEDFVTSPLGLKDTQAEHLLKDKTLLAGFYTSDDGLYGVTPEQNLSNKVAGGGLVSTPTDLVTLGAALLNNTLLDRDSFAEMAQVQSMFDGSKNPQSYGLGWRHYTTKHIIDENNPVVVIHHGGVSVGANAFFMLVPDYDISVAIMTNGKGERSRGEIQMLAYRLVAKFIADNAEPESMAAK